MPCFWVTSGIRRISVPCVCCLRESCQTGSEGGLPIVPYKCPALERHFLVFPALHRFQPFAHPFRKFRQLEEFVSRGDDGFPYPCVIFGNEVHGPADDFHFPVIGEGGYLVQDAADEQGTAITPALSGINPVDGVGAAPDVAFERLPCLSSFSSSGRAASFFRLTASRTFCRQLRNSS